MTAAAESSGFGLCAHGKVGGNNDEEEGSLEMMTMDAATGVDDNLSISVHELFAFLDGEPQKQSVQQHVTTHSAVADGITDHGKSCSAHSGLPHATSFSMDMSPNCHQTPAPAEFDQCTLAHNNPKRLNMLSPFHLSNSLDSTLNPMTQYFASAGDSLGSSLTHEYDQKLQQQATNGINCGVLRDPSTCEQFIGDFYYEDQELNQINGVLLESKFFVNVPQSERASKSACASSLAAEQYEDPSRSQIMLRFPYEQNTSTLTTNNYSHTGFPDQFGGYDHSDEQNFFLDEQTSLSGDMMQFGSQEEQNSNLYESSPGTLSSEHSHSEDVYFRSESSTASSSLCLTGKSHVFHNPSPVLGMPQHSLSEDGARRSSFASFSNPFSNLKKQAIHVLEDEDNNEEHFTDGDTDHRNLNSGCRVSNPHPGFPGFIPPLSSQSNVLFMQQRGTRTITEKVPFELAMQDLSQDPSQPKSEASPPDGFLTVPLLRHQRIALAWMVQKETTSQHCSGGILADDQGLGKTVSAIALILKERSPRSSHASSSGAKQDNKYEALELDVDDAVDPDSPCAKQIRTSVKRGSPIATTTTISGCTRPSAGTLIVCPTSVLRQWAAELRAKVTFKADVSVLVYYGPTRTKDPHELANFDIVLTSYAIVSMEVPKQPDKDDKNPSYGSKKRKKTLKDGDEDGTKLSLISGTLARVQWFRIILDEAQCIKNFRTQVARACWGLRAKRRWCLSGTPIQNSVDDLYSYFRFLRYDPYCNYSTFCSSIKVPINKNPSKGYKKLQAVLKTVMLRRTKGTLLDGKPVINLPPKTVSLMKVDFSPEERIYYLNLEAESREQFKVYAAAGTVKQNYVNILLMLLRLRQACDHPFLAGKGKKSNPTFVSSLEFASKLAKDKQEHLLTCLESSSSICPLCADVFDNDEVVTICGHVYCIQCIYNHINGSDDRICPTSGCRVRLETSLLFTADALKMCVRGFCGTASSIGDDKATSDGGMGSGYVSSKLKAAMGILTSLPPLVESSSSTEKAIVFSQWTGMLDLLEASLRCCSSVKYRRLDGTMTVAAREKAIHDFTNLPEVTVMIMSLKAASLGLNLVVASHVLILDLWWNPTTEDQAIDRAHRIGQTRPVSVSRLTIKDTVEDRILALQEKKRVMVASAFGEDGSGSRQTRLTVEELQYLFDA